MDKTVQFINRSKLQASILTIFILLQSCNLDQKENRYANFLSAHKDHFFEKGWIPSNFIYPSMTDIYLKTNLDLNTCIFSYKLSSLDFEELKQRSFLSSSKYELPNRISIPKWWLNGVTNNKHYVYQNTIEKDSIIIVFNKTENSIFGWRN